MTHQQASTTAGQIKIALRLEQNQTIGEVSIQNSRPTHLGQLLVGLSASEALARIPALFMLCSQAQQAAALGAIYKAQHQTLSQSEQIIIGKRCALEWLKEHCWQLWQMERELFGNEFAMAQSIDLSRYLIQQLQPAKLPLTASSDEATLFDAPLIKQKLQPLFGLGVEQFSQLSFVKLEQWAQTDAPYAKLLRAMLHASVAKLGSFENWDVNAETGSIYRQQNHPLLAQAVKTWGCGLASRTLARLLEVAQVCQDPLITLTTELGSANASRGILKHSAQFDERGLISSYQIDAPTDRYFSPNQLVEQSLVGQSAPEPKWLRQLIWAIDPCVAFTIQINQKAEEH